MSNIEDKKRVELSTGYEGNASGNMVHTYFKLNWREKCLWNYFKRFPAFVWTDGLKGPRDNKDNN